MWTLLAVTGRELSAWNAGIGLGLLALGLWWHGKDCKCDEDKRRTFLKPKWKKYDK